MVEYLLLEDGGRIRFEDGSGFILLETSTPAPPTPTTGTAGTGAAMADLRRELTPRQRDEDELLVIVGTVL